MTKSNIEWTDETLNIVTGCREIISPECDNCYARTMHNRIQAMEKSKSEKARDLIGTDEILQSWDTKRGKPTDPIEYLKDIEEMESKFKYQNAWNEVNTHHIVLEKIPRWRRPRMVFVCSMSDLFHAAVPFEFIKQAMEVFADHPQHTFQILTKRSWNLIKFQKFMGKDWRYPSNVWVGVTVGSRKSLYRLYDLSRVKSDIRWVSVEPLLDPIADEFFPFIEYIDWIVVGGESGPKNKIRKTKIEWFDDFNTLCHINDVAFFFKQSGTLQPCEGHMGVINSIPEYCKGNKGCKYLDGVQHHEMPS